MTKNQATPSSPPEDVSGEKEGFVNSFFGFENLRSLAVLIFVIFAFRWSVVSPYHVPTASMEPTIKVGDRLLAWKLAYNVKLPFTDWELLEWGQPERGDIIVFKNPKDPGVDYVKRVIGVAGDRISVKNDTLHINGVPQVRSNHEHDRSILEDIEDSAERKILYKEKLGELDHWVMLEKPGFRRFFQGNYPSDGGEFTVPEGSLFVMGDNRDNSTDSRAWGTVPMSYVRGQAIFVLWSVYTAANESLPSIRFTRFGHLLQ